jgi:hypothetical protein
LSLLGNHNSVLILQVIHLVRINELVTCRVLPPKQHPLWCLAEMSSRELKDMGDTAGRVAADHNAVLVAEDCLLKTSGELKPCNNFMLDAKRHAEFVLGALFDADTFGLQLCNSFFCIQGMDNFRLHVSVMDSIRVNISTKSTFIWWDI